MSAGVDIWRTFALFFGSCTGTLKSARAVDRAGRRAEDDVTMALKSNL